MRGLAKGITCLSSHDELDYLWSAPLRPMVLAPNITSAGR